MANKLSNSTLRDNGEGVLRKLPTKEEGRARQQVVDEYESILKQIDYFQAKGEELIKSIKPKALEALDNAFNGLLKAIKERRDELQKDLEEEIILRQRVISDTVSSLELHKARCEEAQRAFYERCQSMEASKERRNANIQQMQKVLKIEPSVRDPPIDIHFSPRRVANTLENAIPSLGVWHFTPFIPDKIWHILGMGAVNSASAACGHLKRAKGVSV